MKTRTYISKYHFLRMASLFILLMWQVNVQAQADSTATYTYYDTTMTFNLNEIRASLSESTDLSSGEIEATLQYEPFWRSVFKSAMSNSNGANERVMEETCQFGPDDVEDGCIGFKEENIVKEGGEVTGIFPWCTQTACVAYGGGYPGNPNDPPSPHEPTSWAEGGDCYHVGAGDQPIAGFNTSVNPFEIIESDEDSFDPYVWRGSLNRVIQLKAPSDNSHFIRIGDRVGGFHSHRVVGRFKVDGDKPILKYNYALAIQDTEPDPNDPNGVEHPGNTIPDTYKPYFTIKFKTLNEATGEMEEIRCGTYAVVGTASQNSDFETIGITVGQHVPADERINNGMVLNWQENLINLAEYAGKIVEVEATMAECKHGGHTGWAYLDIAECAAEKFEVTKDGDGCTYNFATEYTGNYGQQNETYLWTFKDASGTIIGTSTSPDPSFTFSESDDYTVELTVSYCNFPNGNEGCVSCEEDQCTEPTCEFNCNEGDDEGEDYINETVRERCSVTFTETITICCDYCASDFAPEPGKEYVISAWAKEDISGVRTYDSPNITLEFEGSSYTTNAFKPSGAIIDGWQRIEAVFTVPAEAEKIKINLNNSSNNKDVFFDDVRIHPFDASMKSFVYDPVTLRLSAELDERNYATYYEYDEEGALIRIKKETERGIMTIQEARNGIRKTQ